MQKNEAREIYLLYNGNEYLMDREEPERFREYLSLHIPSTTKNQWDAELVRTKLRNLWNKPDLVWSLHESIIKILLRKPPEMEYLGSKLLDEMEHMSTLDAKNRILIIENMAGLNMELSDGGVYFFCTCTKLEERMNEITGKIMDFSCDQEAGINNPKVLQDRLDSAKARYRESWQKWSHNVHK